MEGLILTARRSGVPAWRRGARRGAGVVRGARAAAGLAAGLVVLTGVAVVTGTGAATAAATPVTGTATAAATAVTGAATAAATPVTGTATAAATPAAGAPTSPPAPARPATARAPRTAAAGSPVITGEWSQTLADTGGPVALSSPNVDDAVPGGPAVIVGDRTGNLYAYNLQSGHLDWSTNVGEPIDSSPSVNPANGMIYIGTGDAAYPDGGGYLAVTASGTRVWYRAGVNPPTDPYPDSGVAASMTVGSLEGQTAVEAGNLGQETYAMNADNGTELTGFPWFSADSVFSTASLVNLYGNGQNELVSGGDSTAGVAYGVTYQSGGHLRILSQNGQLLCEYDTTQNIDRSSPAVGPFLNGAEGIALGTGQYYPGASDSDKLFAFNDRCGVAWQDTLDGATQSSPAVADVLGNGQLQVVEGTNIGGDFTQGGTVYVLDGDTGQVLWSEPVPAAIAGSITTADLFNEGYQDLLVPTLNGVEILDGRSGALIATLGSLQGYQNSPLVTADADGTMGITLAGYNGLNQGVIDHYEVAGSDGSLVDEAAAWPQFHHDPQLDGTSTYAPAAVTAQVSAAEATVGTDVTYSASVASPAEGRPEGTVSFGVGTTALCTAAVTSGSARCSSTAAPLGADSVTATYSGDGQAGGSSATATVAVVQDPGTYQALAPVRICDTRSSQSQGLTGARAQCDGKPLGAGGTLTVQVAGAFGVPKRDVTAVALNVTAVDPSAAGYLSVFPAGSAPPVASNLNFGPGQTVSELTEVATGAGDSVSLYSSAATDAVVDLEGYVTTADPGSAGLYHTLASPVRICDTRGSNPSDLVAPETQCNTDLATGGAAHLVRPGAPLPVQVTGLAGVPAAGVSAVALNVTVLGSAAPGFATVFPAAGAVPRASNVNFAAGEVVPNRVVVPVGEDGRVTVASSVPADVVVDVSGYFGGASGGDQFTPEPSPVRICDTRGSNPSGLVGAATQCNTDVAPGSPDDPLGPAASRVVSVSGLAAVPASAGAVVANVTAVGPTAPSYLTVQPVAGPTTTSDLNPAPGGAAANLVMATLSPQGAVDVYHSAGATDLLVDVEGWYSPVGTAGPGPLTLRPAARPRRSSGSAGPPTIRAGR